MSPATTPTVYAPSSCGYRGARLEELNMPSRLLGELRGSLNPLSRYDFGRLASLRYAKQWQAK